MFSCEREGALGRWSREVEIFFGPKRERVAAAPPPIRAAPTPAARPGRPRPCFRPSLTARPRVARLPGTGAAAVGGRAAAVLTGERGGGRAALLRSCRIAPGLRLGPAPRPPVMGRHLPGGRGRAGPSECSRAGARAEGSGCGPGGRQGWGRPGPGRGLGGRGSGRYGQHRRPARTAAASPCPPPGPGTAAGRAGRARVTRTRKWDPVAPGVFGTLPLSSGRFEQRQILEELGKNSKDALCSRKGQVRNLLPPASQSCPIRT